MPDWDTIVWGPVRKVLRTTPLLPTVLIPSVLMRIDSGSNCL